MPSEMRSFSTSTSSTLRLDHVAPLVLLDDLLARTVPVEVGEVDHAVDVAVEADEQAELGLVLDLALDGRCRPDGCSAKASHGFCQRLLEAERDAALGRIDLEHHARRLPGVVERILPGWTFFLVQRHFGDVDQAFDARLQLDERAVVGDVGDAAREASRRSGTWRSMPSHGSVSSCFMPSEMRWVSWLMRMICTLTVWPMLRTSVGWLTRRQAMSVTCSRPSMPPRSTNAP